MTRFSVNLLLRIVNPIDRGLNKNLAGSLEAESDRHAWVTLVSEGVMYAWAKQSLRLITWIT